MHIAKNTIYQILAKTITSAIGFFITIILARYYGVDEFGEFTKITTVITIIYMVIDFGLNASFLKYKKNNTLFNYLLSMRILFALLIIIIANIAYASLPYLEMGEHKLSLGGFDNFFIYSISIMFYGILLSSTALFQKIHKYKLYMISVVLGAFTTLALILFFALNKYPLGFIFLSYLIGSVVASLMSLSLIKRKIKILKLNKLFTFKILKESYPLGFILLFSLVYFRIDIIVISIFKTNSDVANYGYAIKYFEFLLAIPLFISNSVYPFLLESLKNLRRFYAYANKYLVIFPLISLVIILPAWFLAPGIAFVKNEFIESVNILKILLLTLPIFFVTNILQWILIALSKQKYLLKIYAVAALINALLNIIFVPKFGVISSAILLGVSESIVLIGLFVKYLALKKSLGKIYES